MRTAEGEPKEHGHRKLYGTEQKAKVAGGRDPNAFPYWCPRCEAWAVGQWTALPGGRGGLDTDDRRELGSRVSGHLSAENGRSAKLSEKAIRDRCKAAERRVTPWVAPNGVLEEEPERIGPDTRRKHGKKRRATNGGKKDRVRRVRSLLRRDGDRCRWCSRRFSDDLRPTLDHITPRRLGGTERLENLVLACGECNSRRSNPPKNPRPAHAG